MVELQLARVPVLVPINVFVCGICMFFFIFSFRILRAFVNKYDGCFEKAKNSL